MKLAQILMIQALFLGSLAKAEPKSVPYLRISQDSPLARELAALLKEKGLEVGDKVVIEVTGSEGKKEERPVPVKEPTGSKGSLNLARYQGKSGTLKNSSQAATRSAGMSRLQVVTLAPVNAITCLSQPRLWWYQSADSEARELEFVLHQILDGEEKVLVTCKSPTLKAGYNKIDLSRQVINPKGVALTEEGLYRWTINIRSEGGVVPVYAHMKYVANEALAAEVQTAKKSDSLALSASAVELLSSTGNWHELFDLTLTAAEWSQEPEDEEIRDRLLNDAGLSALIRGTGNQE